MSRWPRKLIGGLIFLLLVATVAGTGFFFLHYQAAQRALGQLRPLVDAYRLVREQYILEVGDESLIGGALKGMVETLDDPYSEYLPPQRFRELQIQTEGSYGGIGVVLTPRGDDLIIVEPPMPDSPAAAAGLREGDQIVSIDGVPTSEMTFEGAAELIRGPIGTEVVLGIDRDGEEMEFDLARELIQLVTVRSQLLEEAAGLGYIRVSLFTERTGDEVEEALAALKEQGLKGLILDLRGNPGGILGAAVEVAGTFLPEEEPVLHIRARDGVEQTIRTRGGGCLELPLVVLVDGGSASASEIVAGALKDAGRGVLVGTKTFGKGSVQNIYTLSDGGALKLTTALYITAGGYSINGQGIKPDVTVEFDQKTAADEQLEAAVELLQDPA